MKLDLKSFKKVHEDDSKAVMQHPDGHEIHIKKQSLSPEQVKALGSTPTQRSAFDEGGPVIQDPRQPTPQPQQDPGTWSDRWKQLNQGVKKAHGGMVNYADGTPDAPVSLQDVWGDPSADNSASPAAAAPASVPQAAPQAAPAPLQQPASPAAPSDPYGFGAENTALLSGINNQKQGITNEAKAQGDLGNKQAVIQDQATQGSNDLLQAYQKHYNDLDAERQSFQHDLENSHIDPNHFLGSQGTVATLSTGIGLLLGGLGAGNGQGNQALNFLNSQIDRDIKSQEANIGTKKTLLDANMKQFGNLKDATDMTRVMMNQGVQSQLAAAAARATDPLAKARAQQAIGQLQQQSAPLLQQMAMRKAFLQGGGQGMDPAQQIQLSPFIPKEQKEQAFKDLDAAQKTDATRQQALQAFDHLDAKALGGVLNPSDREGAIQSVAGQLVKLNGARYNQDNAHGLVSSLMPKAGDLPDTRLNNRKRLLEEINGNDNSALLRGSGINVPTSGPYDRNGLGSQEQQALKIIHSLPPGDPRAIQGMKILRQKMGQ